ncbi:HlyD family efflux transporter periplasmic adaptor subunit [Merismopedia glauca]|uniref:Membrane fusion protein biotin-lipoyl like domain-containing protein n=1 Tax=Merismopedia glauca CCAP 1448/3 TaxID=1296344 RepID=A0A2T1BYW0_9CYAN|nr:HlyD family efflux transporter periplasmic adaptor subunit [Merismopedia glauca]PSB01199.1 hypothetical protein C7B64_19615 [Merismopedia glauca CCAP 1448/3]
MPETLNSHHPSRITNNINNIIESDRQDWSEATQDLLDALPPIWTRGLVYLLIIVTGITFAWGSFFKMQQTVTLSGEILPQEALVKIDTPVTAKVEKVQVRSGELVKLGQTLIELESDSLNQSPTQHSRKLFATTTGIIHQLEVTNSGEVVTTGETLVQIIPQNSNWKWKTQVNSEQIQGLKLGLPVKLNILYDEKYPTLSGKISQILPSKNQRNTYDLEIAIAQNCPTPNSQCLPLKIGQIATAKIQLKPTHPINLIFKHSD